MSEEPLPAFMAHLYKWQGMSWAEYMDMCHPPGVIDAAVARMERERQCEECRRNPLRTTRCGVPGAVWG